MGADGGWCAQQRRLRNPLGQVREAAAQEAAEQEQEEKVPRGPPAKRPEARILRRRVGLR